MPDSYATRPVSFVSRTPRGLVSDAGGMSIEEPRRLILLEALEGLDPQREPDDLEARAAALAMLAQHDANYLPGALEALSDAQKHDLPLDWILIHLSEALLLAGRLEDVLTYTSMIDQDHFDSEDLHWRAVQAEEMRAAALLGLGRPDEGLQRSNSVFAELAVRGESDDLAAPRFLLQRALALIAEASSPDSVQAGCEVLRAMSSSIDLDAWFPSSTTERIREALAACE